MATFSDMTDDPNVTDDTRILKCDAPTDWLSLIDPVHETIRGTNGNDTLAAGAAGDIVLGLGGDDVLSSAFDRTALVGGRGNDTLTTTDTVAAPDNESVHGIAVQLGDAGQDSLDATITMQGGTAATYEQILSADILADGGSGDDAISAHAQVSERTAASATLKTYVIGGSGDDTIDATADATGALGDTIVVNHVEGGSGSDHITALAQPDSVASSATIINDIDGGSGNDFIDATAVGNALFPEISRNSLHGGSGNDEIHAHNSLNSNDVSAVGVNELWGDQGNDVLDATLESTFRNGISDVTNRLDGGSGDDSLTATANADGQHVRAVNDLEGGTGRDQLTASIDSLVIGGPAPVGDLYHLSNILSGGFGDDSLSAYLRVTTATAVTDASTAENHLDGGAGDDVLTATVADDSVAGASFLSGGAGNDQLTVIGGTGNELDGGAGRDTLTGGSGDDLFTGGGGADAFVFAPPNGHDTVSDFQTGRDVLDLSAFAADGIHGFADLTVEVAGQDSIIRFDAADDITVKGVAALNANDFLFA